MNLNADQLYRAQILVRTLTDMNVAEMIPVVMDRFLLNCVSHSKRLDKLPSEISTKISQILSESI